jgi:hypothetical protein
MGRSSVDATKACLMRAVRAALTARLDRVLPFFLDLDDLVLFLALVAAEVFFCVEELAFVVELAAGVELLAEVCPATGDTAISADSTPARQRAGRGFEFGEFTALILPL